MKILSFLCTQGLLDNNLDERMREWRHWGRPAAAPGVALGSGVVLCPSSSLARFVLPASLQLYPAINRHNLAEIPGSCSLFDVSRILVIPLSVQGLLQLAPRTYLTRQRRTSKSGTQNKKSEG